ncbi:MAG: DUF4835 family protein [Cytophagales bacterium]|nr:DUF4835 family protein [Cytophagales bacterium]
MKILLSIIAFIIVSQSVAQEIFAVVLIDAEQIQLQDKSIFTNMKSDITNFLNNRQWTLDKFDPGEKINMKINIKLQDMSGNNNSFKAITQITVVRPVYGSGYETILLNFLDKDFNFVYNQDQSLDFNENTYTTNLASMLAFYVYIALGMDYDSFSRFAGTPHFDKAVNVLQAAAQSSGEEGWGSQGGNPNNRYWLLENLAHVQFKEFREATYIYYRQALDKMIQNPIDGRKKILDCLNLIKKTFDQRPNSCLLRTYFNSKDAELIKIFQDGDMEIRTKAMTLLKLMDPTNSDNYDLILKNEP